MPGPDQTKEKEFEELVNRFADFIRIHVQKYNLYKYGLDPEDVSQDIRIKIWKLLRSEKNIVSYSSYIKKIVNSSVPRSLYWRRRSRPTARGK